MIRKIFFVLLLVSASVHAEPLLKFITMGGPGSQGDTAIRYLAPMIEKEAGMPLMIINRPGANGVLALNEVFSNSSKNDDVVLIGSALLGFLSNTDKTISFDPLKELEPVFGLSKVDSVIVVPANSPIKSIADMQAFYAKTGRITSGSFSVMTAITIGILDGKAKFKTDVINYRNPTEAATNLTAGFLDYTIAPAGGAAFQPFIESGRLRVVGVIAKSRNPSFPDIATTEELGFGPIEDFGWTAFFVPRVMPDARKQFVARTLATALSSKEAAGFSNLLGKPQLWLVGGTEVAKLQRRELPYLKNPE